MTDDQYAKTVARIQHFFEFMQQKKEMLAEEAIVRDPEIYRHLMRIYEELVIEYRDLFGEFIYEME